MKSFYLLLVVAAATASDVSAASNESGQKQPAGGAALRRTSNYTASEPSRNLDKTDSSKDDGGEVNADGQVCLSYLEDCDCGKYHHSPCCTGHGEKCMPGLTCVKYPPPPPKAADDVDVVPAGDYSSPSGTCVRCGEYEGDPCCEGHKCDIGKMLTCGFNGQCVSCGGPPETRCYYPTGEVEEKCERGEVDASGQCCYNIIHPCCDGECEPGFHDIMTNGYGSVATLHRGGPQAALVCNKRDQCQFCGTLDEQCCDPPGEACQPGFTCAGGECVPCGGEPKYYCCNPGAEDELQPVECAGGMELDANGCYEIVQPCCGGECEKGFFASPYKTPHSPVAQDVDSSTKARGYTPMHPLVCTIEQSCHFCGAEGQQCCSSPNDPCEHGAVCQGNKCVPCGGAPSYGGVKKDVDGEEEIGGHVEYQPCCDSPMPCETGYFGHHHEPLVCSVDSKCEYCGRADRPCCDGMKCDNSAFTHGAGCVEGDGLEGCTGQPPPLVCTARGICEACGMVNQPCCQGMTEMARCPGSSTLVCNSYNFCEDTCVPSDCVALPPSANQDDLRDAIEDAISTNSGNLVLCPGTVVTWNADFPIISDDTTVSIDCSDDCDGDLCVFDGDDISPMLDLGGAFTWTLNRIIFRNGSGGFGGAIFANGPPSSGQALLSVTNCEFRNNMAARGGAIYVVQNLQLTLEGCVVEDNEATDRGGALYGILSTSISLCPGQNTFNTNTDGINGPNDYCIEAFGGVSSITTDNPACTSCQTFDTLGGDVCNLVPNCP